jgi:ABC-type antimicrobial peptide transport system permease subunit
VGVVSTILCFPQLLVITTAYTFVKPSLCKASAGHIMSVIKICIYSMLQDRFCQYSILQARKTEVHRATIIAEPGD